MAYGGCVFDLRCQLTWIKVPNILNFWKPENYGIFRGLSFYELKSQNFPSFIYKFMVFYPRQSNKIVCHFY